ncbi:hypothetical protein L218DRAFT_960110 [Marasmius fiardii PR-910]|nr:hypothetical protein L218DRAFT_960110 [Marasmius fiardii PR-910]
MSRFGLVSDVKPFQAPDGLWAACVRFLDINSAVAAMLALERVKHLTKLDSHTSNLNLDGLSDYKQVNVRFSTPSEGRNNGDRVPTSFESGAEFQSHEDLFKAYVGDPA